MTETPHPKPPSGEKDAEPEQEPGEEDEQPYSSDEEAEVAARLESLGYM